MASITEGRPDNEANKFQNNSHGHVAVRTVTEIDTSGTGPIEVTLGENGNPICEYNEQNLVAAGATIIILSYLVPLTTILLLKKVEVSGENIAVYSVKVDGVVRSKKRTYWDDFNASLELNGVEVPAGSLVTVEVENFRNSIATFNTTLLGHLRNE